jgi:hypothetical protein
MKGLLNPFMKVLVENCESSGVPIEGAASKTGLTVGEPVEGEVPRSGAPPEGSPPFLDKEGGNVPTGTTNPVWTKKQWGTRRQVIDRLRYWQSLGYQCLWITLMSAPNSPDKRLRRDFQILKKRAERKLEFGKIEYICVDTREGHGVLHMIWAWRDPNA